MNRIIDCTHGMEPGMPVYPGTEPPNFAEANTIARDGFAERKLIFYSHTGTHMDAPAHMVPGGRTLDSYTADTFTGRAVVLHHRPGGLKSGGLKSGGLKSDVIGIECLKPLAALFAKIDWLLVETGWSRFWGKPAYFEDFPTLSPEACEFAASFNLKGIGVDTISIDRMDAARFPNHHILFSRNMLVIENLTSLDLLPNYTFRFFALPLYLMNADGAPVRAIAEIGEGSKWKS